MEALLARMRLDASMVPADKREALILELTAAENWFKSLVHERIPDEIGTNIRRGERVWTRLVSVYEDATGRRLVTRGRAGLK